MPGVRGSDKEPLSRADDGATPRYRWSHMYIRRSRSEPLTTQLYRGIRDAILSGALAPESRVPSTPISRQRRRGAQHRVARLRAMLSEGYPCSGGAGTYVAPELPATSSPARRPLLRRSRVSPAGSRRGQRLSHQRQSPAPVTPAVAVDFRCGPTALDDFPRQIWQRQLSRARARPRRRISTTGAPSSLRNCGSDLRLRDARAPVTAAPDQIIVVHGRSSPGADRRSPADPRDRV
jgi:GntR family transcriptional regulator/MocR family aminotransferase